MYISERLIGLREIRKLAIKHHNTIVANIDMEILEEETYVSLRNIRRKRKKLIGK